MDGRPDGDRDPVLSVIFERAAAGSRPRQRADGHRVCLAVEGGGMRAAVTAGMCAMLGEAGLMDAFDCVYGCSAGALNGAYAAAGQATVWATSFEDTANRQFIDRRRVLRRRPVLDMDFLSARSSASGCRSPRPAWRADPSSGRWRSPSRT